MSSSTSWKSILSAQNMSGPINGTYRMMGLREQVNDTTTLDCDYTEVSASMQKHRRHHVAVRFLFETGSKRLVDQKHPIWLYMVEWLHANLGRSYKAEGSLWRVNKVDPGVFFKHKSDAAMFKFMFHKAVLRDEGLNINGVDLKRFMIS